MNVYEFRAASREDVAEVRSLYDWLLRSDDLDGVRLVHVPGPVAPGDQGGIDATLVAELVAAAGPFAAAVRAWCRYRGTEAEVERDATGRTHISLRRVPADQLPKLLGQLGAGLEQPPDKQGGAPVSNTEEA